MIRCRSVFGLLLLLSLAAPLFAHDLGLSWVQVKRASADLKVVLTLAPSDFASLGVETGLQAAPATEDLVRCYLEGAPSSVAATAWSFSRNGTDEVIVVLDWRQIGRGALRLEFPVLAKLPFGHRMIVKAGEPGEVVALLDARHASWNAPRDRDEPISTPPKPAYRGSFVLLGVEHILTGFDHLCFLFALLLVAPRARHVLAVVTTFTVAHSLTLAGAATGLVSLSPRIVEPLIAASIVYVGIENLFLRRPSRRRLALVFGFGLIHGLGFATALAERLPGVTGVDVVLPLLGFNVGVELGQLAVAGCLVPMIWFVQTRATLAPRLQSAFSLMIAMVGIFWFSQRI